MKELSLRQQRVGSEVRTQLARILPSALEWDPILKEASLTVLVVRMSSDLRLATVTLGRQSMTDSLAEKKILLRLKERVPQIRKQLARAVQLRFVPDVRFRFEAKDDETLSILLQQIRAENGMDSD